MMDTIAPFWDGNETWLVVIGAGLFAAFPVVYAVFLGAFYFPVLLLLFGLIFRGVAFEFRFRSERMRGVWDWGFFLGSTVVAFVQGAAVGAMIRGIPVVNGQYAGGRFGWLAPVSDADRHRARARLRAARRGLARAQERRRAARLGLRAAYGGSPSACWSCCSWRSQSRSTTASRAQRVCSARPWGLVFPAIGVLALAGILVGARQKRDGWPFAMTALFFLAAFLSLGVMFWPYMIPYSITVAGAAAPEASLRFLFYGGVVVLPVIAAYTIGVYWVFRGKVRKGYG